MTQAVQVGSDPIPHHSGRLLGRSIDLEVLPAQAGPMTAKMLRAGTTVIVTDAHGREHEVEALSGVEKGHSFPVVWIARPLADGGTDHVPWPADAVRRHDS